MAGSSHPNRLKALCVFYVFGLVTSQSLVPNIAAMPRDPLLLTSAMMPNFTSTYTNLPLKPQHLLQRRQDTCYAPNYVCNGGQGECCGSTWGCCGNECMPGDWSCCDHSTSHGCPPDRQCCKEGCIYLADECCQIGTYCPSPYRCYKYDNSPVCCTDSSCLVYLGNEGPVTRTPVSYQYYYFTYYWYYWSAYYTVYYSPSTYTTATTTTITRTSIVSIYETESAAAAAQFASFSQTFDPPTPTDAEAAIPATPTGEITSDAPQITSISSYDDFDDTTLGDVTVTATVTTSVESGPSSVESGPSSDASRLASVTSTWSLVCFGLPLAMLTLAALL